MTNSKNNTEHKAPFCSRLLRATPRWTPLTHHHPWPWTSMSSPKFVTTISLPKFRKCYDFRLTSDSNRPASAGSRSYYVTTSLSASSRQQVLVSHPPMAASVVITWLWAVIRVHLSDKVDGERDQPELCSTEVWRCWKQFAGTTSMKVSVLQHPFRLLMTSSLSSSRVVHLSHCLCNTIT